MKEFEKLSLEELVQAGGHECACGRTHVCELKYLKIGKGAINDVAGMIRAMEKQRPFVVCDGNTYKAAGEKVCALLKEAGIEHVLYIVPGERPAPAEWEVGSVLLHYDPKCDMLLAVGSGVINDICKVVAHAIGVPSAVVGTAPSMDGYASDSSSYFSIQLPGFSQIVHQTSTYWKR